MTTTEHGIGRDERRPVVVDLYARLSRSADGSTEKVDTQVADCRAFVERNGWTVGAEHVDNSLSAWRRGCGARGGKRCWRGWSSGSPAAWWCGTKIG